jgi:uncharacterized protein (DUF58 family)
MRVWLLRLALLLLYAVSVVLVVTLKASALVFFAVVLGGALLVTIALSVVNAFHSVPDSRT